MAKMAKSSKNDQYYEERRDNGKLSPDLQPQSCHYIHKMWQKAILGRPVFKNETRQKMSVDPLGSPLMYAIWPFRIIKCCDKSAQRPCSQGWFCWCYSDPYWTKWTQTDGPAWATASTAPLKSEMTHSEVTDSTDSLSRCSLNPNLTALQFPNRFRQPERLHLIKQASIIVMC